MPAYNDNPQVIGDYVWIKADDTANRRSRASQITAEKRRYEKAHDVKLTLITQHYDETEGFLPRSASRYKISRPVVKPLKLTSTTQYTHPAKPALNARQRRLARNGAMRYSVSMP